MTARLRQFLEEVAAGSDMFAAVEALLDAEISPTIITDADDKVVLVNATACSLLGLPAREVDGRPIELLLQEFAGGRDGGIDRTSRPIRSSSGAAVGNMNVLGRSKEKQESKEMDSLRRRLLEIERTNAEMRDLEASRSHLLSNVSHELRTPLVTIIGYVEMITAAELGEVPEEVARSLKVVLRNAVRLSSRIDDLLNLSRLQEENIRPVFEWLSLAGVIEGLLPEYHLLLEDKDIQVDFQIQPDLPPIPADRRLTTIAVENVLKNAIGFSPPKSVVRISVEATEDALRLTVEDEGPGVAPAQLELVFDPFYQVDNSPTRSYGGIGLGLAIVRRIVTAHSGRVWLESDGKRGTAAVLEFPRTRKTDAA